jgi:hypothetical protein
MRTGRISSTYITTLTGMGYDTLGVSNLVGPQRNVGLVAGSYTVRTKVTPGLPPSFDIQIIGVNLSFAPESDTTVALLSGLVLLGVLGARKRIRKNALPNQTLIPDFLECPGHIRRRDQWADRGKKAARSSRGRHSI